MLFVSKHVHCVIQILAPYHPVSENRFYEEVELVVT